MPIDTSMYQNARPAPPIDPQPSLLDTMSKVYSVADMANKVRAQQGMRDAYAKNTNPNTGELNQQGFLSDLGKISPPDAFKMQTTMAESTKLQAEAQTAKLKAADSILEVSMPKMQYLASMSPADRAKAFNPVMQDLKAQGVPTQGVPQTSDGTFLHDEDTFQRRFGEMKQSKVYLAQQIQNMEIAQKQAEISQMPLKARLLQADIGKAKSETAQKQAETGQMPLKARLMQADIGKAQSETAQKQAETGQMPLKAQLQRSEITKNIAEANMAPAKYNAELYGARSPNVEISAQYAKDAAPLKSSQMPMKQMMDNYAHPSPQGDASLVLNAFKIKFPTAPDVNSLEELSKSQATPDRWKQMANHAISGGLDQGTRDNLMRDGISTFRANYDSLNDVKDRYSARAQQQNINDKSLTYEPAMDRTYRQAMTLQDKIGPYVPPSERGGWSGALASFASKITGTGGGQSANSSDKQQSSYRPSGASVSGDEVAQYATKHGMKLSDAQTYLRSKGYAIDR